MAEGGLRHRGKHEDISGDAVATEAETPQSVQAPAIQGGSYWLTRVAFVRALGFVYCKSSDNTGVRSHDKSRSTPYSLLQSSPSWLRSIKIKRYWAAEGFSRFTLI